MGNDDALTDDFVKTHLMVWEDFKKMLFSTVFTKTSLEKFNKIEKDVNALQCKDAKFYFDVLLAAIKLGKLELELHELKILANEDI